jgi:hypothetical protein
VGHSVKYLGSKPRPGTWICPNTGKSQCRGQWRPGHGASSQPPSAPPASQPATQAGKIICDRPRKAGPLGRRATHTVSLPNIWLLSAPGTAQPVPGLETGWGLRQLEPLVPPSWLAAPSELRGSLPSSNVPMTGCSPHCCTCLSALRASQLPSI